MAEQAAALLATLHLALSDMLPPQRPVPSFLEARFAHDSVYRERVLIDTDLDLWLAEFYRANPTRQVVHGDFYPGNVLADQGSLVAVLDWDDACVMALEAEVACAAMEWSGGMDASMTAMRGFVLQYERAAGHSIRLDDKDMAQFIRHRLRCEAKLFELRRKHGTNFDDEDHAYHARRLEKFWKLRP